MRSPDLPWMNLHSLATALEQGLEWRRDESSRYWEDGVEKFPIFTVVVIWDDGRFIHFVLQVEAGSQSGFLGYCYEDNPERWSWNTTDVYAQEVSVLSDRWFYGEDLVAKIYGAAAGEIRWQDPVPDKYLPPTMEELCSIELGVKRWEHADFSRVRGAL